MSEFSDKLAASYSHCDEPIRTMTTATSTPRIEAMKATLPDEPSPQDLIQSLQAALKAEKDFHRLFDAKLIEV